MLVAYSAIAKPAFDNWIRVDTKDLSFTTNLTPQTAQELAQNLLDYMSFSEAFLPRREGYSIPLRLIVFSEKADFDEIVRPGKFASFTHSDIGGVLIVAAPSSSKYDDLLDNLKHELSHYQMRHSAVNYPLWYEEGMATMLSNANLAISENSLTAEFKTPKPSARFPINQTTKPIRQTWLVQHLKRRHLNNLNLRIIHNFYNDSHRMAHLFHFNTSEDTRFSLKSLNGYFQNQSDSLFSVLNITPRDLMNALQTHQSLMKTPQLLTLPAPEKNVQISVSNISEPEALKLMSIAASTTNPQGAIEHLLEATSQNQSDVLSMLELAKLYASTNRNRKSTHFLSKAKTLDLENPKVRTTEATMLIRSCSPSNNRCSKYWQTAGTLIREALESEPENIEAIYSLGVVELYSGRPGTALNYLKIAEEHAPWSPRINFHLGEALRLLGDPAGIAYLIKARNWSNSDVWRNLAEKSISEYR